MLQTRHVTAGGDPPTHILEKRYQHITEATTGWVEVGERWVRGGLEWVRGELEWVGEEWEKRYQHITRATAKQGR